MAADLSFYALTHGLPGLGLTYASVQGPMLAGLVRARAAWQQMILSPLIAVPVMMASGLALSLIDPALGALGSSAGNVLQATVGAAITAAVGYATGRAVAKPRAQQSLHRRGTMLLNPSEPIANTQSHATAVGNCARGQQLTVAGVAVPLADETKHFKFIGTTGTGKSTAIAELLAAALRRGDRAVIADPDGGYLRRYYDPARGDVILNPFDQRSAKWNLFGEIQQPYDVEQLARSLIPDQDGDRIWRGYARTFLTAITRQAHAAGVRDVGELYRLLAIASTAEQRVLTMGTPAQPFLEEHNSRMFDSIRSVTSSAVASLEHIAHQRGAPFSVREWVGRKQREHGGVLFIPYQAGQIAALRTTISAWMRIAIFEAMAGFEGDRRLWFVVDELDALGQIDGLKDALARLRKFGGRCVLGLQSIAQVASTYGTGDARTVVENCGNTLILRCSASEGGGTSRFASTLIGQREVLRTTQSKSRRPGDLLSSVTHSQQVSIESAVMDSEIEQLPDLAGYLKFASSDRWLRVALQPPQLAAAPEASMPAPKSAAPTRAMHRDTPEFGL